MADKKQPAAEAEAPALREEVPAPRAQAKDPSYTAAEFAANAAKVFGSKVPADCVTAAFRLAGKDRATRAEARSMVEKFMKREVK